MLVASENLTVMVSPSVNPPASSSVIPSGSAALIDVISGPAFSPKSPSSAGDIEVEASDVPAWFLRLADFSTPNLNPLTGSLTIGPAPPVLSIMVMTRVEALVQEPI